ncbi:MAG: GspE/PulE family protein [Candidatus Omnitrophica bacterium]|nr:GspE/PulE family protein [Candidatus Omnitrophota bacterium]
MPEMRIGELLVSKKILTGEQLDEALADRSLSGRSLSEIVAGKGWASEEQAAKCLSEQAGLAFLDLAHYTPEPGIVQTLPLAAARKFRAMPLFKTGDLVTVAMADPLDGTAVEEIRKILGGRIRPVFSAPSLLKKRMEEEYGGAGVQESAAAAVEPESRGISAGGEADAVSIVPVVKIVDGLFSRAIEMGASDIHLEPQGESFYCRFRVDGVLRDLPKIPKQYEAEVISRIKILANMDIAEKRLPQDGRIQIRAENKNVDLRISTFPTIGGENVVIRILNKSRSLLDLKDLGFESGILKVFERIILKPYGIILVTGPTGSGKSTTLYSVLNKINSIEKNIVTMEDPIEYEIERVRQSQVNIKAGLTFASGLRSILRQDPDIIMIGEIRDRETAEIAIHAALTGHLVFSTLHTNDAVSAATRLMDMGIESFLLVSSLACVVAQRLVRILCPRCKEAYHPDEELLKDLKLPDGNTRRFYREKGCRECRNSGYTGRIGIFEMLIPDDEIRNMIIRKVPSAEIRNCASGKGMKSLYEDGINKLAAGITSYSEVLRVTHEE